MVNVFNLVLPFLFSLILALPTFAFNLPFGFGELSNEAIIDFQEFQSSQIIKFRAAGLQSIEINNIAANIASLEYQNQSIECLGGNIIEIGFQNPSPVSNGSARVSFVLPSFPNKKDYSGQLIFKALDAQGKDLSQDLKINFLLEEPRPCPAVVDPVCYQLATDACDLDSATKTSNTFLLTAQNTCTIFSEGDFLRQGACLNTDTPRRIDNKVKHSVKAPLFLEARQTLDLQLRRLPKKFKRVFLRSNGISPAIISVNERSTSKIKRRKANISVTVGDGPSAELFYIELFKKKDNLEDPARRILTLPIVVAAATDTPCDDEFSPVCGLITLNSCRGGDERSCPIQFVRAPTVKKTFTNSCEAERFAAEIIREGECIDKVFAF